MLSCGTHQYAAGRFCKLSCAVRPGTYATRTIANRCLRVRRHPAYPVCCRIRRLYMRVNDWHRSAVNLSDSTCYVWHDIRDARHCPPNDYHPQPTCTFRMQQYTCNNNPPSSTTGHHDIRQRMYAATYTRCQPPSSTPGHHDIRQDTHATTYTVCRFTNSRAQASLRPASSVFRHMHHLNNRRRCASQSSHNAI